MPLPLPQTGRTPLHTRTIRAQSYARDDGQWDIDVQLVDVKAYDFTRTNGTEHRAGEPVHDMLLRITFNDELTITDAVAAYDAAPYGADCTAIAPDYGALVGMNLLRGFRQAVKTRFGRTAGCTHMSELSGVLPTVAVQTMAKQRRRKMVSAPQERPFQLEGCHALRLDGPVVREYYPKWYAGPGQAAEHK
ncbi:DUF2889 domain-containing protein [Paracandidimonas soli]|uniref:DUF2889 domain-containing protein n=1 Tax=Paracandidimonas soli TaxID=1917182 RepID=UPI0033417168